MDTWVIAALPLVGVLLGAGLQFWSTRAAEREKHTKALQAQAYADYLRAVAAAGHVRCDGDHRNAQRDAADAKARIAVYGSAEVIAALARFEDAGAVVRHGPAGDAFVSLVSSMRAGLAAPVPNREVELVLLGPSRI